MEIVGGHLPQLPSSSSSSTSPSYAPSIQPSSHLPMKGRDTYYDEKQYLDDIEEPSIDLSEVGDTESDSPIEEVRVTISNTDDPTLPYNTFRMWFLGLVFTCILSFVNQFFYLRQTSVQIGYPIVALVSLPLGHFLARVLPTRKFRLSLIPRSSQFSFSFCLNPGPFSIKEHVLIGTMAACNSSTAYAVDIVILQKLFYDEEKQFIAGLLLVWTTQITGFAISGALRRFLVRPAHMIWPQTLVTASLFRGMHAQQIQNAESSGKAGTSNIENSADAGRMSRPRYFLWITLASALYYFLPGFIFPAIGTLSILCWISPHNIPLAQLTGSSGLGIGTLSLDWAAVSYYTAPLVTPWFAQVNILIGFIALVYCAVPLAYYTNLWDAKLFPIVTSTLFREDGSKYDVQAVLGQDGLLDEELYQAYGPLRMSAFLALAYGIGFAGVSATVMHTILYHGKELAARFRSTLYDQNKSQVDVHARMMCAYPEVPDWWYTLLFLVMVSLSFVTVIKYDYMPWWCLILALGLALLFVLPIGIVQATTNQQPGLNILSEYLIGSLLPGHAIANVTFKTYAYISTVQALNFVADLKLGHYMKIPPQTMFLAQLVSSVLGSGINLATATWLVESRKDQGICTEAGFPFTCRSTKTFYSASVIWGAIGPARVFGPFSSSSSPTANTSSQHAIYASVQYGFLIGALLPLITYLLSKHIFRQSRFLKLIHWPVLLTATSMMPPALPYFYSNGFLVGFIFAFLLRRYRFRWWSRYNYLTSAALDTGVAVATLIIYFCIQLPGASMPHWWGSPDPSNPNDAMDHCVNAQYNFYGK